MSEPYYNEGVGQGGFIATFTLAGDLVVESLGKDDPSSHIIQQPNQVGAPLKWAGVSGFKVGSCLVQLPFDGNNVTEVKKGEQFTVPDSHGGGIYVVTNVGATFQVGDYHKANLSINLRYNA
jgi:hypothetical protein